MFNLVSKSCSQHQTWNIRHPNQKGRNKTVTICRWYYTLYRKPLHLHQNDGVKQETERYELWESRVEFHLDSQETGRRQWHPTPVPAGKISWMEEPGRRQSMGSIRVGHNWATSLSLFTFMHWRRKWQPTPVFLPGESQGWGSLVGCRLWGRTESDTTEVT